MCHVFFIHSPINGHLGCFHVLAIVNSAAMNIGAHVSFLITVSLGYMPSGGIVGSFSPSLGAHEGRTGDCISPWGTGMQEVTCATCRKTQSISVISFFLPMNKKPQVTEEKQQILSLTGRKNRCGCCCW